MKIERMWVHPSFKKRIKLEAIERNMSVLELTKGLADSIEEQLIQNAKKKL